MDIRVKSILVEVGEGLNYQESIVRTSDYIAKNASKWQSDNYEYANLLSFVVFSMSAFQALREILRFILRLC